MSFKFRNDYKFSESREFDPAQLAPTPSSIQNRTSMLDTKYLQEELSNKSLELQETQAELLAVKHLVDQKDQMIFKLKEDLRQSTIMNNKSVGEQRFLHEEIYSLQKEQERMLNDYEAVLTKLEILSKEKNDSNKYIDTLENNIKALEQQYSEVKSSNLHLELALQEVKVKEQDTSHEVKVFSNQISILQEQENEYLLENRELKSINQELDQKITELVMEIEKLQDLLTSKENLVSELAKELGEYQDILGDVRGTEEEARKTLEEKERGLSKIKELIVSIEKKDQTIEEKNKIIVQLQVLNSKAKEEKLRLDNESEINNRERERLKERIQECLEKIELYELREAEVQKYLERKTERLRLRSNAETQLREILKSA